MPTTTTTNNNNNNSPEKIPELFQASREVKCSFTSEMETCVVLHMLRNAHHPSPLAGETSVDSCNLTTDGGLCPDFNEGYPTNK